MHEDMRLNEDAYIMYLRASMNDEPALLQSVSEHERLAAFCACMQDVNASRSRHTAPL